MKILAFDLGRSTGWAILDGDELRTGSHTAEGALADELFIDWHTWAKLLVNDTGPEAIAYEDIQFNRGKSYIPGMTALLYVLAGECGLTCFGVNSQELKAFARLSSAWDPEIKWAGSKLDMRLALTSRWPSAGSDFFSEDEVDAAWVALWAEDTLVEEPRELAGGEDE